MKNSPLIGFSDPLALFSRFTPLERELVPLPSARSRVLAEDIISAEALPPFSRSTMDGYAVRAVDTLGCSEAEPARLTVIGEIAMGTPGTIFTLRSGQAVRIATGGELPQQADAVVMVEHTSTCDGKTIALCRAVAPKANMMHAGEDYPAGAMVLAQGNRLRPQELGVLAGLGITAVPVYRRPKVALLSTGDELVPVDRTPPAGQIRDINSTTLAALIKEAGGIPIPCGICGDDLNDILAVCTGALAEADVLLLSGGSSRGRRDCTLRVFQSIPHTELLTHGVSVRPGKASILARQGNKAIFGLPGPVASAMMTFYLFVRPLLRQYAGLGATLGLQSIRAITTQQIPATLGREEHIRVSLTPQGKDELPLATPLYGKSGVLNPLVRADGLLPISREVEGFEQGTEVTVLLFP